MAELTAEMKNTIAEALETTYYKQGGFALNCDNPQAVITFLSRPEFRFLIGWSDHGFTTTESPGMHSDEPETFQRSDFDLCVEAIKRWAERIRDREGDSFLDEFGGVADRMPDY